ncbi:hypothetical protein HYU23_00090 [Candidatus Woesearchaeota archaeon]|nr:hypothetical protein [Candidatus Woesearchaeota archaeon]
MSSEDEARKIQEKILEIETMAKKFMTQEAISRYGTLKSAHIQKALQAIALIAQLASQNQIKEKITDEQFKQLLMRLEPEKKETRIIRK